LKNGLPSWKSRLHLAVNNRQGKVLLDSNAIMKILAHRYPFLLIDRVVEYEPGKKIVSSKNVTMNEPFFEGHFPGHPVMPGVLIIEGMAQTGGLLFGLTTGDVTLDDVCYFVSINAAKFRRPVRPGDQLRFEMDVTSCKHRIWSFSGKAYVDGKLAAEAELKATLAKDSN
jgi:3-hydroxyacyl-[acyl-carrier-protein] dehydratase